MHMILSYVTRILLAYFKKKFQSSSCPRELLRDIFSTGGKQKFAIFKAFRAYLKEFLIFFHEIFIVARYYQVLVADINSLLISALVSLEERLKVSILAHAFDLGQ